MFSSCKVAEETIAGIYYFKKFPKTKLVLKKDKTFEFVKNFSRPGIEIFGDSSDLNFRTTGTWQLNEKKQLVLNSFTNKSTGRVFTRSVIMAKDSNITSISFWDFYDDPVPIRFMKFSDDRIKFHLGNSISFFAPDFNEKDTMEFHFYGYKPYTWPDPGYNNADNNRYKIILNEENRQGFFKDVIFIAKRKKLIGPDKHFNLKKTR